MPKRHYEDEDSDDYIRRKMRKLERKLLKRKKRSRSRISSSSSGSESSPPATIIRSHEPETTSQQPSTETEPEASLNADAPSTTKAARPTPTGERSQSVDGVSGLDKPEDEVVELDEDILNLLGETSSKEKTYGPKIQKDLAIRWEHISSSGLSKETRKELLEKYLVPENCKKCDAPTLNPEIKAALSETLIKKDKAIENKQKQLSVAIACLGDALTKTFSLEHKDQSVIKLLIDAGRIICDAQHTESMSRRSFICSNLKKEMKDQLCETKIDNFLFGDKLADTLKAAKAINKSGSEIKTSQQSAKTSQGKGKSSRSLISKLPLPNSKQTPVGKRLEPEAVPASAPGPVRRRTALLPPPPPLPPPSLPPPPPPPQSPQPRSQPRAQQRR